MNEKVFQLAVAIQGGHVLGASNFSEFELQLAEELADLVESMHTPNAKLPQLVPEGPRRKMLVEIEVSADFEKRLDNQWEVEREINADRWTWRWADQS